MVKVGFFSLAVVKDEPSITKTFFTSCIWLNPFRAERLGSSPMRQVPCSWMAEPSLSSSPRLKPTSSAPAALQISSTVSYMCSAIFRSLSPIR